MGIDISAQPNLQIDTKDRVEKNPRAACFVIEVPGDIRLSIKPVGGFQDYAYLFHEMGHAQHYATTAEHAVEFAYLGEQTVTETYAFLSEYLLANQAWLRTRTFLKVADLKDLVRFEAFLRLLAVRRSCAQLLFELRLYDSTPNPEQLFAQMHASALGYIASRSDEKRYLVDLDPHYYVACYLRAEFLQAQLNGRLRERFGVNWFENRSAGEYLRSLWAMGDRINGDELASQLGDRAIAPEAWLAEIRSMALFSAREKE
jgi:hypothetical protein